MPLADLSIGDRMRLCPHPRWVQIDGPIHRCPDCGLAGELATWRDAPEGFKRCRACDEVKPLDAFYDQPSARDRHTYYCKPCHYRVSKFGIAVAREAAHA